MGKLYNLRDGSKVPLSAVRIDRTTKWGNPFIIGEDGSREEVIEQYRSYLWNNKRLLGQIGELKGKDLACWCAPLACHGDVLLKAVKWHCEQVEGV